MSKSVVKRVGQGGRLICILHTEYFTCKYKGWRGGACINFSYAYDTDIIKNKTNYFTTTYTIIAV